VDVGALGANWTYAMHRAVGREGFVFAFEAHPFHARATAIAMRLMNMGSTRLFPFGLSSKQEEALLRVRDARGESCEGQSAIAGDAPEAAAGYATIRLETLDSLIAEHPRLAETRLLKIDVEGYELFVLQGARELIRQARPCVILEKGAYEDQGYTCGDVHAFLADQRYRAFVSVGRESLAATDASLEHPESVSPNRVFLPEELLDGLQELIRP
jgi:FkbM family methyltransferase